MNNGDLIHVKDLPLGENTFTVVATIIITPLPTTLTALQYTVEKTIIFYVNTTPPEITIYSPVEGGEYNWSDIITVDFTVDDPASGIESVMARIDCNPVENGQEIAASELGFGNHFMLVRATSCAGLTSEKFITFHIHCDAWDMEGIIDRYLADGLIKNKGIATALKAKLDNMTAFRNFLDAQGGKKIDSSIVPFLESWADYREATRQSAIYDGSGDYTFPQDWYLEYFGMQFSDYEFIPAVDLRKVSLGYYQSDDTWRFRIETEGSIQQAFQQYGSCVGFQIYIDTDRDCVGDIIICTMAEPGEAIFVNSTFEELGRSTMDVSDSLTISVPASVIGNDFNWFVSSGYADFPAMPVNTPITYLYIPPVIDMAYFCETGERILTEWIVNCVDYSYPLLYYIIGKSTADRKGKERKRDIGGPKTEGDNPQNIKDWYLKQQDLWFKDNWTRQIWVIAHKTDSESGQDYLAKLIFKDNDKDNNWDDKEEPYVDNNPQNGKYDQGEEFTDLDGDGKWDAAEPGFWIARCRYGGGENKQTIIPDSSNSIGKIAHINYKPKPVRVDEVQVGGATVEVPIYEATKYEYDKSNNKLTVTKIEYAPGHPDPDKREVPIGNPITQEGDDLPDDPEKIPQP